MSGSIGVRSRTDRAIDWSSNPELAAIRDEWGDEDSFDSYVRTVLPDILASSKQQLVQTAGVSKRLRLSGLNGLSGTEAAAAHALGASKGRSAVYRQPALSLLFSGP